MEELQMVALNELLKQQQQIIESQEEIKKELQAIRNSKEQLKNFEMKHPEARNYNGNGSCSFSSLRII